MLRWLIVARLSSIHRPITGRFINKSNVLSNVLYPYCHLLYFHGSSMNTSSGGNVNQIQIKTVVTDLSNSNRMKFDSSF